MREVAEESGLVISQPTFLAITNDLFAEKGKHYVTLWMTSEWQSGEPTIIEPEKCTAQGWFDFQTLPAPLFEPCWQNLRLIKPELFR